MDEQDIAPSEGGFPEPQSLSAQDQGGDFNYPTNAAILMAIADLQKQLAIPSNAEVMAGISQLRADVLDKMLSLGGTLNLLNATLEAIRLGGNAAVLTEQQDLRLREISKATAGLMNLGAQVETILDRTKKLT